MASKKSESFERCTLNFSRQKYFSLTTLHFLCILQLRHGALRTCECTQTGTLCYNLNNHCHSAVVSLATGKGVGRQADCWNSQRRGDYATQGPTCVHTRRTVRIVQKLIFFSSISCDSRTIVRFVFFLLPYNVCSLTLSNLFRVHMLFDDKTSAKIWLFQFSIFFFFFQLQDGQRDQMGGRGRWRCTLCDHSGDAWQIWLRFLRSWGWVKIARRVDVNSYVW